MNIAQHKQLGRAPMLIGAFFDIDGTLLGPPSLERRFLRYLRWRGALSAAHWARWLGRFLRRAGSDWIAATEGNKAHLAGLPVATVGAFTASLHRWPLKFFPEALQRLEWHAVQGHAIFLVSGTLAPLAELVARQLLLLVIPCATRLEMVGDRWTGEVVGEAVSGPGKARGVERLTAEHHVDLARSYAYGDSWNDRWMLERVGYPAAVNPGARLARLARQRGWPVLRWGEANSPEQSAAPAALEMTATTGRSQ